ncbi:MAG TPA: hypothetical protein VK498_08750, partial [Ferruginibacter sp.]|nr:hypothetical protein [Ferruginibacter sp.]
MIKRNIMPTGILFLAVVLLPAIVCAQDTSRKQSINIISTYKPVLRNAVKINFSGSQLPADTSRNVGPYNIPAQNLFYAYQPISLKPLALEQDSNLYLGGRRYLKAGFGNFNTPYLKAGISFGDGKTSLVNITGRYISSKGTIKNQDYSLFNIKGSGSYFGKTNEIYGSASFSRDNYYLYGYNHALYDYKKATINQQFQDLTITAGIRNTAVNDLKIKYNPNVQVNYFTNVDKLTETNLLVDLPVEKMFGENFSFKVDAKADITRYSTIGFIPNNYKISNDLLQVSPALVYSSSRIKVNGGITPIWNNGEFDWVPNIYAEGQLQEKVFLIQAGWVGRYIKNNYKYLSGLNPYLAPITAQLNTKEVEFYGGIKATLGNHFNFSGKVGWITYHNLPFFINDTSLVTDEKDFIISNETRVNDLRVHADVSYISHDKLTLTGGLTLNGYTGMQRNAKA